MMLCAIIYGGISTPSSPVPSNMMVNLIEINGTGFREVDDGAISIRMEVKEPESAISPTDEKAWEELPKNILRAEMMKNGVSYAALAERLAGFGITDNEVNLRNKVARGRFTAVFLMQCLTVLGADWIKVPSLEDGSRKGAAQGLAKTQK
jgi:hypothetical protein